MSDSVQPHRRQPTRLPRSWDSPGKNTGVGCHFLLQCMKAKSESEVAQSCPTLHDPMDCSLLGSSVHGILQAKVLEWGATEGLILLCLCFLIYLPSRFILVFLPRSKCLNFVAAITIYSDFGAQKNKVNHCFHCFPIYFP